jgi:hypothetical protein
VTEPRVDRENKGQSIRVDNFSVDRENKGQSIRVDNFSVDRENICANALPLLP